MTNRMTTTSMVSRIDRAYGSAGLLAQLEGVGEARGSVAR